MTIAMAYAQELLTCLSTALNASPNPPPEENICLRAGDHVSPMLSTNRDECCEGLAWVRIVRTDARYGPDDFNTRCVNHLRRTVLEMGVVRCMPTPGAGEIVSCAQWTAVALQMDADHSAMEAALCCLKPILATGLGDPDLSPGDYEPRGPDANCIGGTLTLTIEHACACGTAG